MAELRRRGRPYFFFCNLFDVHAPYPPAPRSILRPLWSPRGWGENLRLPFVMPCLGGHTYLRAGFRLSDRSRRMLLDRYHRAIELMDAKLATSTPPRHAGVLDDTLLVVTSDHGEGFGEHGLYLHDASVYETHLHVPLWIRHPEIPPRRIDDVVSTRDLFGLMRAAGRGEPPAGTILDPAYRAAHPIALAEHFYYPHRAGMAPRYRQNIAAAVCGTHKGSSIATESRTTISPAIQPRRCRRTYRSPTSNGSAGKAERTRRQPTRRNDGLPHGSIASSRAKRRYAGAQFISPWCHRREQPAERKESLRP